MDNSTDTSPIGASKTVSRRRVFGLGAAATAAVVAAPSAAFAADEPTSQSEAGGGSTSGGFEVGGQFTNLAAVPIVPGARLVSYGMYDFVAQNGLLQWSGNGVSNSTGSWLALPLRLPAGARVVRIDTLGNRSAAGTQTWPLYKNNNLVSSVWSTVATLTTPSGTTDLQASYTTEFVVAPGEVYYLELNASTASNQATGVVVQYIPPTSEYHPIAPVRVYDSRSAAPAPGILGPNQSRTISIKDSRNSAGTVIGADVVPVGATAVTFNVTATGTSGPNYLAVAPGDAAGRPEASTLNWAGGYDIANASAVTIDASRQVKVFMGDQGGSSHFILDITGYYL